MQSTLLKFQVTNRATKNYRNIRIFKNTQNCTTSQQQDLLLHTDRPTAAPRSLVHHLGMHYGPASGHSSIQTVSSHRNNKKWAFMRNLSFA
jgi:hypothetical protein